MLPANAPKCAHHNNHHDGFMNFMHRDEEARCPHSAPQLLQTCSVRLLNVGGASNNPALAAQCVYSMRHEPSLAVSTSVLQTCMHE